MLEADNVEPGDSSTPTAADDTRGEQSAPTDAPTGGASPAAEASGDSPPVKKAGAKKAPAKKTAAKKTAAKKTPAKRTTKKVAAAPTETEGAETLPEMPAAEATAPVEGATADAPAEAAEALPEPQKPARKTAKKAAAKKAPAKRAAKKTASTPEAAEAGATPEATDLTAEALLEGAAAEPTDQAAADALAALAAEAEAAETDQAQETAAKAGPPPATALLFQPPDPSKAVVTRRRKSAKAEEVADDAQPSGDEQKPAKKAAQKPAKKAAQKPAQQPTEKPAADEKVEEPQTDQADESADRGDGEDEQGGERRRRRRGGRRRRRSGGGDDTDATESSDSGDQPRGDQSRGDQSRGDKDESSGDDEQGEENGSGSRRRRRRRRSGESSDTSADEPENTVTRVRKSRTAEDEITALSGSTRLEAKKQRRREGREAGRRRAPIVSEAEFLARRESVDRVMVIRQRKDLTQIAVMEDKVLVEHYVSRESQNSLIGNVYLGRVQNVLPSMEAAFIDIGKGRNAVLYAGEVNWDALGAKNGQPRKIESVLKSGQPILVQVTKDPIGHKGARLTSQISIPGRFLVYVPDGTTSGISRKLPDTERNRLKTLLKEIVPDSAGVIVRTAAEGASEDELTRDVERLTARWNDIEEKSKSGNAPQLLYGEPDLTLKVVRDLFTEDFGKLVIAGEDAWDMVENYVSHVAPDLADRLERYDGERDVFAEYRIDEQIEKALDRKVWLPSGGSLVIDRTEAMTVVDVNTGKFTGSGGNLEETVTKNNLEAAEEIVRQLRLRDIGGIIVVDFIDMVLESNRDLVLRRLVECLGRDRTRHQVAEVTSLGLVQMTRKRIGTGLLEAFSESCEHCQGRGLVTHHEPVEPKKKADDEPRRGRRSGRGRGRDESGSSGGKNDGAKSDDTNGGGVPSPKDFAAMARHDEDSSERSEGRAEEEATAKSSGKDSPKGKAPKAGEGSGDAVTAEAERPDAAQAAGTSSEATSGTETRPESEEKPSVRTRSRGGRGRGGRSTQPQAETQAEEQAGEQGADAQAVVQSQAGAEAEQPRQPSDNGSATAGSPAAETPTETASEATPSEPSVPAAPKIVTSVRRRGARRAAGPPPGASTVATTDASSASSPDGASPDGVPADAAPDGAPENAAPAVEPGEAGPTAEAGDTEPSGTPHVPVKKRGSRRR